MGNTPKLGQWRPDPKLDMGLGYCYRCIQFMTIAVVGRQPDKIAGFVPNFACTLAPWPMGPAILVLPACFDCMTGQGPAGTPGTGLIAANGRLPGQ